MEELFPGAESSLRPAQADTAMPNCKSNQHWREPGTSGTRGMSPGLGPGKGSLCSVEGSGCLPGLTGHTPAEMLLGQGHQSQQGSFRSPKRTHAGVQPCALCPTFARWWLWHEPHGKARLSSWYPAGDEAAWLSGEGALSPISTALLLPRHWENRSMTLTALSNAEMFPKSPRCPMGRSDVNFCTTKVICFREFYLCKSLAVFHAIHISRGRFLIKAGRQEDGQEASRSELREAKSCLGFNGTTSIYVRWGCDPPAPPRLEPSASLRLLFRVTLLFLFVFWIRLLRTAAGSLPAAIPVPWV